MTTPIERLLENLGEPVTNDVFRSDANELAPKMMARGLHDGHVLHHDDRHLMITTAGAREHADQRELWAIYRRFIQHDWGNIQYQEDIDQNNRNVQRERGILLGIYASGDGTQLWVQQNHRYAPPTIMLPEER